MMKIVIDSDGPTQGEPLKLKTETDIKDTFKSISDAGLKAGKSIEQSFENLALDVRRPIESIGQAIQNTFLNAANVIFASIIGSLLKKSVAKILGETAVGAFFGLAGGGRTSGPTVVNERGTESLSQGKGIFIPVGGPATVRNAANTRSMGGGMTIIQNFNIQTGLPDQIFAIIRSEAARSGADAARTVINRATGRA